MRFLRRMRLLRRVQQCSITVRIGTYTIGRPEPAAGREVHDTLGECMRSLSFTVGAVERGCTGMDQRITNLHVESILGPPVTLFQDANTVGIHVSRRKESPSMREEIT